ncbi:hypothetical protein Ptr902_11133 [Pyrenophora tritici-repentis]|uniref:Uncharacterized protein n=2 Tax=Pyrenophora tritici-repentis TaxID=45151 RepID=A0A2W1FY91_9PLEO|nr:uncharacterized protein PTRG_06734 [Pyrenophora tritici-repentis Pt-1C-BFP]KAA8613843.1 hypothetical protein PtrV1_12751 [Pyrenophora tritici-repentis]EDU49654.1 predicted protein [Pyrenophora tritici-repentis Pt-1C-BFP]KAF7445563.1 hypothetical protein A1F99_105490 [Pyrenophora tritici-repentis]KAF7565848.1 hypothetical protein PtrM4_052820 [Pyrenophora tritici-repentis]KAI0570543.1 hypothetical protein Alg215_10987 [Pyrenophora tritici-repentis]
MDGPRKSYPGITPGQPFGPAVPPKDVPPVPKKRLNHLEPLMMLNDIQTVPKRRSDGWVRRSDWPREAKAQGDGRKCDSIGNPTKPSPRRINEMRVGGTARETKRDTIELLIEDVQANNRLSSDTTNNVRNTVAPRSFSWLLKPTDPPRSTSVPQMSTSRNEWLSVCASPYTNPRTPPVAPFRIRRSGTHGSTQIGSLKDKIQRLAIEQRAEKQAGNAKVAKTRSSMPNMSIGKDARTEIQKKTLKKRGSPTHSKTATCAPCHNSRVEDMYPPPRRHNITPITITRLNNPEETRKAIREQHAATYPVLSRPDKQKDGALKRRTSIACMETGIYSKFKAGIDDVFLHVRPKAREKKKMEVRKERILKKMEELKHDGYGVE